MRYEDELGFKLNIPRVKNESVIEHIKTSRECIFEMRKNNREESEADNEPKGND